MARTICALAILGPIAVAQYSARSTPATGSSAKLKQRNSQAYDGTRESHDEDQGSLASRRHLQSCADTDNGATDSYGYGCFLYDYNPTYCGYYDDADFSSYDMCCACVSSTGGDDDCVDTNDGATDPYGDGCGWYESNSPGDDEPVPVERQVVPQLAHHGLY